MHQSRLAVFTLAACAALASATQNAVAADGHLYVQNGLYLARFPLMRGIPAAKPDLTYTGYSAPVAVAPDGTVYATLANASQEPTAVYAFAPGRNQPFRRIDIRQSQNCSIETPPVQGLAVDGRGFLFALVNGSISGNRRHQLFTASSSFPCDGVVAYKPGARGNAEPVSTILLNAYFYGGMTVTARDDLYIADQDNSTTYEYANALRNPTLQRSFVLPSSYDRTWGAAVDRSGNLYLLDGLYQKPEEIDVFPPRATGWPPARTIEYTQDPTPYYGIAVGDRYAYVISDAAVELFKADSSGMQTPVDVLTIQNGNASGVSPIALGP